jgi:hypothetical protein
MSANNNAEAQTIVAKMAEKERLLFEILRAASTPPVAQPTPGDIAMIWEAIDGIKARIADLEARA